MRLTNLSIYCLGSSSSRHDNTTGRGTTGEPYSNASGEARDTGISINIGGRNNKISMRQTNVSIQTVYI
jgi:hypothetical protein